MPDPLAQRDLADVSNEELESAFRDSNDQTERFNQKFEDARKLDPERMNQPCTI